MTRHDRLAVPLCLLALVLLALAALCFGPAAAVWLQGIAPERYQRMERAAEPAK